MTLVPTGTLVLAIKETRTGVQAAWFDGQRKIKHRLNEFVKQLFAVAEAKGKQVREPELPDRDRVGDRALDRKPVGDTCVTVPVGGA